MVGVDAAGRHSGSGASIRIAAAVEAVTDAISAVAIAAASTALVRLFIPPLLSSRA